MDRVIRNSILFAIILAGLALPAQDHEFPAERKFATIQKALGKGEFGFSDAIKAYRKLIRAYPETQVSVRARYEIGELFEKIGEVEKASEAYIVILDKYPDSQWFPSAIENLYRIGCYLFRLKRESLLVNTYEQSRKIFRKLLEIAPHSENTAEIQYKAGVCSTMLGNYVSAAFAFKKIIEDYPAEPWLENASYQFGICYFKQSLPARCDQTMTDKAISELTRFRKKYPGSKFTKDAVRKLSILQDRKAESLYLICLFYKKQKEQTALLLYCDKLNHLYPDTKWAAMASALLKAQELY